MNTIFFGLCMRRGRRGEAGYAVDIMSLYKCLQISATAERQKKEIFIFIVGNKKKFYNFFLLRTAVIWLKVMAVKISAALYFVSLVRFIERTKFILNIYFSIMSNMNVDKKARDKKEKSSTNLENYSLYRDT